ncbi:nascent polypeptide-associated complex protein [Candidatus Woesearchaeota archaeon]|nr:nascent polypeptide-associated complex protein [Candidatus Woesearchaeota archaeon]
MMPGMNPRQMRQAMQKMGVQQEDIEAEQVIIRCADKDIIIEDPQVAKVTMMGQKTWQVVGEGREERRDTTPDIDEEDVKTVMDQTGKDEETAKKALEENKGDIAKTIMELSEKD